jgi:hypothetical protein
MFCKCIFFKNFQGKIGRKNSSFSLFMPVSMFCDRQFKKILCIGEFWASDIYSHIRYYVEVRNTSLHVCLHAS